MILKESKWDYEKSLWICNVLGRCGNGNYVFYRDYMDCGNDYIVFAVMRLSFVLLLICVIPAKAIQRWMMQRCMASLLVISN